MHPSITDRKAFTDVVNSLCRVLSYPEHQNVPREDEILIMEMSLEEIPFAVSHSLVNDSKRILIEAEFGQVPNENAADILFRLLHLSRELSEAAAAALAINPETSVVTYTYAANLSDLTGSGLLEIMTEIAWRAKYWKENYFLAHPTADQNEVLAHKFISLA